jgi:hypothetical protein
MNAMRNKKPIMVDGKPHRMRRGKLVEIPAEWVGKVTSQQQIQSRPSKAIHKHRKMLKHGTRKSRDELQEDERKKDERVEK